MLALYMAIPCAPNGNITNWHYQIKAVAHSGMASNLTITSKAEISIICQNCQISQCGAWWLYFLWWKYFWQSHDLGLVWVYMILAYLIWQCHRHYLWKQTDDNFKNKIHTTRLTMSEKMDCRIFGARPLPEPILTYYCRLDPWEQTPMQWWPKCKHFRSRQLITNLSTNIALLVQVSIWPWKGVGNVIDYISFSLHVCLSARSCPTHVWQAFWLQTATQISDESALGLTV